MKAISFLLTLFLISCTRPENNSVQAPNDLPDIAAKVAGKNISWDEVHEGNFLELYQLQEKEYQFQKKNLDKAIQDRLLIAEAKKKNLNVDQYLAQFVLKENNEVSKKELEKFLREKNLKESSLSSANKEQILKFLSLNNRDKKIADHIEQLKKENSVEVHLKAPTFQMPKEKIARPSFGDQNSAAQVIQVSDFQCDDCRKLHSVINALKKKHGKKIEISYLYIPASQRVEGRSSAEAAICAFKQETELFWKVQDSLMPLAKPPTEDQLIDLTAKAGAKKETLQTCLKNKEAATDLQAHLDFANLIGVRASPSLIINGLVFSPDASMDSIEARIHELAP